MKESSNMKNYSEYIFNLLFIDDNLIILNKYERLLAFVDKCKEMTANSQLVSLMDKNTLVTYDTTLRLLANVIYERIPAYEEIELDNVQDFEEFRKWLATLDDVSKFALVSYLNDRGYINIEDDEDLQFMINVLETVRVMEQ
jgi:endonuclease III-like uncharacterized protein